MKPLGPIPPYFTSAGADLLIGGVTAKDLVAAHGNVPLYAYDFAIVQQKIALFREQFGPVKLHYAVKANPFPPLLQAIAPLVDGMDVASAREVELALKAGMDPSRISFAGPGKRDQDIAYAVEWGVTLNCESLHQIDTALRIGASLGVRPRLAIRVNPDFDIKGSGMRMGGGAKPFGIDSEDAAEACLRVINGGGDWRGLHIFTGSQALSSEAIIAAQTATLDLAASLSAQIGRAAPLLNMGGGFGIPYFANDTALDTLAVSDALKAALDTAARNNETAQPRIAPEEYAIELGRWLVGEAGVYLTQVIDIKTSRGHNFAITDGGMQHHLAASGNFGQVIRRNYPVALANKMDESDLEETTIVGCLCTPLDKIAESALLPRVAIGDIVAVFASGAYGLSASPQGFLSQEPAKEVLLNR